MATNTKPVNVVVSMTYGATSQSLFGPTKQTLERAIAIASKTENSVLICLSEHHANLNVKAEDGWLLRKNMVPKEQSLGMVIVANTINEPFEVQKYLDEKRCMIRSFTLVCDKYHAMRVRHIWRHLYPDKNITIEKVDCVWRSNQPYWSQRGPVRWFLTNFIILSMMRVFGIEKLKNLKQSS